MATCHGQTDRRTKLLHQYHESPYGALCDNKTSNTTQSENMSRVSEWVLWCETGWLQSSWHHCGHWSLRAWWALSWLWSRLWVVSPPRTALSHWLLSRLGSVELHAVGRSFQTRRGYIEPPWPRHPSPCSTTACTTYTTPSWIIHCICSHCTIMFSSAIG